MWCMCMCMMYFFDSKFAQGVPTLPPHHAKALRRAKRGASAKRFARRGAMLYADKAALENRTKLRLLAIRERELTLYTQNCFTIGTVSALMAGLAYSSLLYTKMDYFQDATPFVQTMYLLGNVVSMYLALRAMTGTTMIAMFGPGKVRACVPSALRGAPRLSRARIA